MSSEIFYDMANNLGAIVGLLSNIESKMTSPTPVLHAEVNRLRKALLEIQTSINATGEGQYNLDNSYKTEIALSIIDKALRGEE